MPSTYASSRSASSTALSMPASRSRAIASRRAVARVLGGEEATALADPREGIDGAIDVLAAVRGGELHADARLALRYDRIAEADDVDAFAEEVPRHLVRHAGVADHDRNDGMVAGPDLKSRGGAAVAETLRVRHKSLAKVARLCEQIESRKRAGDDDRRHGIREQIRPRALPQQLYEIARSGRETARRAAERLAQRRGDDVDATHYPGELVRAAAARAHETGGVRVVDQHHRFVTLGQRADLRQLRHVAVNGKDAVGEDEAKPFCARGLETATELGHVRVGVPLTFGLAQTNAVDDRGVIQGVGDDGVVLAQKRLEHTAIRVERARKEDAVLRADEVRQPPLQLLVPVLRAADEPHTRHPITALLQATMGRLHDAGVRGQAEVVVGAEVEDAFAVDHDLRSLRRLDEPFG